MKSILFKCCVCSINRGKESRKDKRLKMEVMPRDASLLREVFTAQLGRQLSITSKFAPGRLRLLVTKCFANL